MKKLIAIVFFVIILTGCANGALAEATYFRCPGFEEYKEAREEYTHLTIKQEDILYAYRRIPLNAVTTKKNGVTTTVLVNPLEEERDTIAQKVAVQREKMKEFEKTCSLYKW